MKKSTLITLSLLAAGVTVKAQSSVHSNAQPDSIIKVIPFGEGRQTGYLYTIGGKLQTREDVAIRLMAYAPSAQELHLAKRSATWTFVSLGGFAASSTVATIEYATHNKHAGETTGIVNGQAGFIYQHHSLTGAYIFTGMATAFLVSTFIHIVKAGHHGDKALHLYNQRFE